MIEMLDRIGSGLGKTTRWTLTQDLSRYQVQSLARTTVLEITPTGVRAQRADGQIVEIPADTVVLGVGAEPENRLVEVLERLEIPFAIAGDAGKVGTAFDAVHSGYQVGCRV